MKIVYPNRFQMVNLGPAETINGYPLANLLDEHLLKIWKADGSAVDQVALTLKASGPHDAVALFQVQADSAQIEVYGDEAMLQLVWQSPVKDLRYVDRFGTRQLGQAWFYMPALRQTSWVKIILGAVEVAQVSVGVALAGVAVSFPNPTWGTGEGLVNHSIRKQLKNGSEFKKKKPVGRKIDCKMEIPTKGQGRAQYREFLDLYLSTNGDPMGVIWAEGIDGRDDEHSLWASFGSDFRPVEGKYSLSTIQFNLIENL